MGIAGNHEFDPTVASKARVDIAEVQPVDLAIDLERDAMGRGAIDQTLDVDPVWLAPQEEPARRESAARPASNPLMSAPSPK